MGLLLFVCFFIYFLRYEKKDAPTQTQKIVAMGDSLFAMYSDERSVVLQIGQQAGEEIFDASFGGTTLAKFDKEARLAMAKDAFSFAGLSQAIATRDFRLQLGTKVRENATLYFEDRLKALSQTDFSQTQLLILEYGVNDYQMGNPLEAGSNPYNDYSYEGALRKGIMDIQKAYPDLEILVLTPTYIWYPDIVMDGESREFGYGGIDRYADMAIKVAKELGVHYIDLYHDFYPHEDLGQWLINTDDGIHPNVNGRAMIAEKVGSWIAEWEKNKK